MRIKISFSNFGLGITLLFALIAELYRFHGFLLVDLFVPIFVAAWTIQKALKKDLPRFPQTLLPAALFLGIGLASLLINSIDLTSSQFLESVFYGVRFASFYFLSVIVFNQTEHEKTTNLWMLAIFTFLLSLAGFVQVKIMPNFTSMEALGWDPHQGRLLSTWFDPNFVGGFLAFIIPVLLGAALDRKNILKFSLPILAIAALATLALLLTLSRSAYLAFIAAMLVFGLLRSVKLLAVFAITFVLLVAILPPVQSRFISLVDSIGSATTSSYTLPDASSRLRYASWEEAWNLFMESPLIGQGYNRYKYAALELGTLKDTEIHSASGSDSSLLNVLATTGIFGGIAFFAIYLLLAKSAIYPSRNFCGNLSCGFFAGIFALTVHSIFVNSLLFPLIMAPFWICAGLIYGQSHCKNTSTVRPSGSSNQITSCTT
ncbi:MAG: O-antigen ligase family protein [Candidatus Gracilibacteria bacterium]|jgi:hypothetical protein